MKKSAVILMGALAMCHSSTAIADAYLGINYAVLEQDDRFSFDEDRFDTGDVFVRLGADINDVFSSELRVGVTASPQEESDTTFKHNYIAGAFLRADREMGVVTPYLVLGFIQGEEELELPDGSEGTETFDDFSVGVGVDLKLRDGFGFNAEYIRYYDIGDVMLRGPSAGVYWRF